LDDFDDGYEAPVFQALTEPIQLLGVHRETALLIWGISVMLVFAGQKLSNCWIFALAAGLHVLLAMLTRRDPDFLAVLATAIFSHRRLDP
jgi:type IV secretory pathway VirB3-like protein